MNEYLNIFIDNDYPDFIDKYLNTKTLNRLKYITQFCGCDYTKLYNQLFLYTRFDHSLVVSHMTWHFSKNKKETIVALLHDVGTPCFAHCIDYVFGDYLNQESSERDVVDIIKEDEELLSYLESDGISLDDFDFSKYKVLENKSPRLCTDRLDGVLHTCYVWLHTHDLDSIKRVYNNIVFDGEELSFCDENICLEFVKMVYNYAKELQGNKDKYIMKYISEVVKKSVELNLITINDLYTKKEEELVNIFKENFSSFLIFENSRELIGSDSVVENTFYISFSTKKRNVIPLLGDVRIDEVSTVAKDIYLDLDNYCDCKFAYIEGINKI